MADPYSSHDVLCKTNFYRFLEDELYAGFLSNSHLQEEVAYISLTLPIETIDPLTCLRTLNRSGDFQFFWEIPQADLSMAAGKALITIKGEGSARFEQIRKRVQHIRSQALDYSAVDHSYSGMNFLGGFSFDTHDQNPEWMPFGQASFFVPEWNIVKDKDHCFLTLTLNISGYNSVSQVKSAVESRLKDISNTLPTKTKDIWDTSPDQTISSPSLFKRSETAYTKWINTVSKAKAHIKDKKFDKIVLAREFKLKAPKRLSPLHIVNDLRQEYPGCYSFLIGWKDKTTFIGSSPERLAAFRKDRLLTEALAGSIQRGLTSPEDTALANRLLNSSKNTGEHNFVIKAIEQNLKSVASGINRKTLPAIKKFANVQHLFTPITAKVSESLDRFTILENLHPTPAVGGYPWEKASAYLWELESFNRGWYAGPLGWLNRNGDGEFTVAIRSGLIKGDTARFYAGCGIVKDSDPDAEWKETTLKLMPMLSALRYD